MILEPGQFGIFAMKNANTSSEREMLMVYKGMDLSGMPTIKKMTKLIPDKYRYLPQIESGEVDTDKAYVVELGYNENIFVKDRDSAITLFNVINGVLVSGEKAEDAINNMLDVVENVFFQKETN